ncbi:hypothetical protein M5K25_010764 [Dendrobium thyrsiflorum]|uniref:Uncharacterized protein n=1 Tax=Dendrobium thyrsiflorum TaxID=117978 RepID=A0ABD0V0X9_DENTH
MKHSSPPSTTLLPVRSEVMTARHSLVGLEVTTTMTGGSSHVAKLYFAGLRTSMDLETENHLAALLVEEARRLRREAEKDGVHVYLQKPNVRGRPNSRFLTATVLGVEQEMTTKKVDALEERFEGEMSQIKAMMEDRLSSVEGKVSSIEDKVSDLHLMMKRIFENQIQVAALEAKGPMGRTTNSDVRRRESDGEILEEKEGRYRDRRGNREYGERGVGWEKKKEGNYGRRGADFGEKREESEERMEDEDRCTFSALFISANRAAEISEMWRAREKERELDAKQRHGSKDNRSGMQNSKPWLEENSALVTSLDKFRKINSPSGASQSRHENDQRDHSRHCSSSKRYSEESHSRGFAGLHDDDIEEFLHSRVKRGRGSVGCRMDEPGPYLPSTSADLDEHSVSCAKRAGEERKPRILGPEKPHFLKSNPAHIGVVYSKDPYEEKRKSKREKSESKRRKEKSKNQKKHRRDSGKLKAKY